MQIKVLVVDDSRFYRNRLCNFLSEDPQFQVVGTAENGKEAVEKVKNLKPDVVTMDIEMPIMDGISAVREIMKSHPVPVLMFSSLTSEGAQATLDALDAGAADFMLKRLEDMAYSHAEFAKEIRAKVRAIARRPVIVHRPEIKHGVPIARPQERTGEIKPPPRPVSAEKIHLSHYKLIAIGASTGGPSAIQGILTSLPKAFPLPVIVVQHMPAAFTGPFARRLDNLSQVSVKEASDGDEIQSGRVYIAPGGKQMVVEERGGKHVIRVKESGPGDQYKPSVDVTFNSIARSYGKGVLAVILTGMGSDGCNGSMALKKIGSSIWAQDEQSCVVYGMPHAVVEAKITDRILSITDIARHLALGT